MEIINDNNFSHAVQGCLLTEGGKTFALGQVQENSGLFRPDFHRWLSANWEIWERFEREAERVWATGRRRYSSRTIIEILRHETLLTKCDATFKINNSYVPDLGRLYGLIHVERNEFFECREMSQPCVRRRIRTGVNFSDDETIQEDAEAA